jgi:hypothetical protein
MVKCFVFMEKVVVTEILGRNGMVEERRREDRVRY